MRSSARHDIGMDQQQVELYVVENHDQLYHIWSQRNVRNLHVCHIDFHCDLRGLLIDRSKERAYKIPDIRRGVDIGNFLSHAIVDGRIEAIDWVHGTPGGRSCDVHTVKYTEDVSALPYNLAIQFNYLQPLPLKYSVNDMDSWLGPAEGDFLDIDWDVFAERAMKREELEQRVDQFFSKRLDVSLAGICVCYSPTHSHDTRAQFERFVRQLEDRYRASRVDVPEAASLSQRPLYRRVIPPAIYPALQAGYYEGRLWLKRRGIH